MSPMVTPYLLLLSFLAIGVRLANSQQPDATTECEAGTEFALFLVGQNFESAKQVCETNQATLARISNKEERNRVIKLIINSGNPRRNLWIGKN